MFDDVPGPGGPIDRSVFSGNVMGTGKELDGNIGIANGGGIW
jgi:hypothetical protein